MTHKRLQIVAGIIGVLLLCLGFIAFYTSSGYGWLFTILGSIAIAYSIFTNALPSLKK